jgi:hypothetical protein
MISMGYLSFFPLKQALFRAFQIAQHIAETPHKRNFFPVGSHWSHQAQHWAKDVGTLLALQFL